MAILQSTRQTLTKSMPSIFDNKNSVWPDPEQSIGEECLSISGLRCWLPIGPALAAFEVLAKDLQDLLDKHKDALKQGEPKPRAVSFNMWMTGSKPESSSPTIVFSSKSPRQRTFAKALLKDSKLLDQYPGVRVKTLDRMPAIYQAGPHEPDTIETRRDSTDNVPKDGSEEAIFMVDDSRGSCGALIAFGRSRLATMGGILLINGTYYGISAQHGRYEFLEQPEDATNGGNSLCFDDDSDTEDSDLDDLIEITSSESISSHSDEGSPTLSFTSTTSPKDRIFEEPMNFPSMTELSLDHIPEVPSPSQPTYSSYPKISNLLPYERNELDYEVFKIDDPRYHRWNKIDIPSSGDLIRRIIPNKIARTPVECPVWAATGTTGCVQGTMMRQPHYIKMEDSETFQEMWAIKLDRNTKPGDSGAWVVDRAGQLYGHIVAGDPMLGLAFIIPACKIFEDINSRFGGETLLCPPQYVVQPYNPLNDCIKAEQRRLHLIRGKGTVPPTSVPTTNDFFPTECLLETRGSRLSKLSGRLRSIIQNHAPRSNQLFQFRRKPLTRSSLLNKSGKPLLEWPLRHIGHPQAFAPMNITQWFRYQLILFYTSQLTRLGIRKPRTMKDAFLFSYCHVWNTIVERYYNSDHYDFECFLRKNELLGLWDILWRDEKQVSDQLQLRYCRFGRMSSSVFLLAPPPCRTHQEVVETNIMWAVMYKCYGYATHDPTETSDKAIC
ncbi:hypothetical protein JMJ35_005121 [Cladonia borealis]|uniref:Uncharacterized protein n=1 Tax=Cladonia borealis TaxID=184061 RepID=A0AA39V185_9LECA|nr:hypothetical protein JMJ35_005121 [Cladonia borealis]